jgi:hypothetical protein
MSPSACRLVKRNFNSCEQYPVVSTQSSTPEFYEAIQGLEKNEQNRATNKLAPTNQRRLRTEN